MEDRIYLVYQGEYSDRCVIGAFYDEKKAEKYAEIREKVDYPFSDSTYVSEVKIMDDIVDIDTPVQDYYHYSIDLDDPEDSYDNNGETMGLQCDLESFHNIDSWSIDAYSTRSLEHAKKIAIEAYQVYTQNKAAEKGEI